MLEPAQNVCVAGGLALNALLDSRAGSQVRACLCAARCRQRGDGVGRSIARLAQFLWRDKADHLSTRCAWDRAIRAAQIKGVLENCKLRFRYLLTEGELIERAIEALKDNKIVAWMQGRMEFGPRALGNRSILASPLNPYSTENLNVYIKHRESYRKFAASVPEEHARRVFRSGRQCALSGDGGQGESATPGSFFGGAVGARI